jgi:7-carboxy-7-deazaguanine synthase
VLRVSEVYASVQGEGPRTGQSTVFVRFGGCNLRCPGWPCDTQHAIDPAYRNTWEKLTAEDLLERVVKTAHMAGAKLITLTGGEPFLQKKDDLLLFVHQLVAAGYTVECFSNGTLEYPDWAVANIKFIMDWKLPGSGESHMNSNRLTNINKLNAFEGNAVKFVCKDEEDFFTAVSLWSVYLQSRPDIIVYYGKVWEGKITDAELAEHVISNQLPWRMNVQLHNYVWDPQERGR